MTTAAAASLAYTTTKHTIPADRYDDLVEATAGIAVDFDEGVTIFLSGTGGQSKKVDFTDYDLVLVDEGWKPACDDVAELPPSRRLHRRREAGAPISAAAATASRRR